MDDSVAFKLEIAESPLWIECWNYAFGQLRLAICDDSVFTATPQF